MTARPGLGYGPWLVLRPDDIKAVRAALLAHYAAHKRDLPWRRRQDVYGIWLSEIMLQQTQVETVRHRYEAFLDRYPTVEDLARASEAEVCEAWAGLGYYRRARNLHRAARVVVEERGGAWPRDRSGLEELPGVGRYTAGAIASIALGERVPAVDGNVVRVVARLIAASGRADERTLVRAVTESATALADAEAPGDVNQALMDLGATICKPRGPDCQRCPVRPLCAAWAAGEPERYPSPALRAEPTGLDVAFAWVATPRGVLLRRRPTTGLWAGQWELPSADGPRARRELGARFGLAERLCRIEHRLTHRFVIATVYRATPLAPDRDLVAHAEPLSAPLSALARKAICEVGRRLARSGGPGIVWTPVRRRR